MATIFGPDKTRHFRKVIRITADDSPNVKFAKAQIARGEEPTGEMVVPGVLSWEEYCRRLRMFDEKEKSVSLYAIFYKGKEIRLFPKDILDLSKEAARKLPRRSRGKYMGIDAAEGGDNTCWSIVDDLGLVFQLSIKTADTSDIPGKTIGLMREYGVDASNVLFDRGGGGKQHADVLRRRGYSVRTIGFGESANNISQPYQTASVTSTKKKVEVMESRYVYKNRRAEIYGKLSLAMSEGFAVPEMYDEVYRQLSLVPKNYDDGGRLFLPPKDKPHPNYTGDTLKKLIGCSPDEAESLGLANYMRVTPIKGTTRATVVY